MLKSVTRNIPRSSRRTRLDRPTTLATSIVFATTILAVAAGQTARTAGQQTTFRAGVEYVEIDARALDDRGEFVSGLVKDDFEILEDGAPQTIATFMLRTASHAPNGVLPGLVGASAAEPDVQSNEPFQGGVYLLVLDDLHTDPLRSQQTRRIAREFVEKYIGPGDLAAVVATSGRLEATQELTTSRRLILRSIDAFIGRKVKSSTLTKLDEYDRLRSIEKLYLPDMSVPRVTDDLDFERERNAGSALDALSGVAGWMSRITGQRKALLFISEGIDYEAFDGWQSQHVSTMMSRGAGLIIQKIRDVIDAASRSNVNIYSIDPRGLATPGQELMEVVTLPEDTRLPLGPQSLMSERQRAKESLQTLADETGGFAIVDSNTFERGLERIAAANSAYYLLGYYPTHRNDDGSYRKIEVRVSRPGIRIVARKGYLATRKTPAKARELVVQSDVSPEIREALNAPVPLPGMRLAVFAAPFRGEAGSGKAADNAARESLAVVIQIDGQEFAGHDAREPLHDRIELALMAIDAEGKVRAGDRHIAELNLKPDRLQTIVRDGFRFVTRLDVPPGRYQLKVASRREGSGRIGSVNYDLEVPDFQTSPVSLSGIVLTSSSDLAVPTPLFDKALQRRFPFAPTTNRAFRANENVAALVEIYTASGSSKPVDTVTTMYGPDGVVLEEVKAVKTAEELKREGGTHVARLPLDGLMPGTYRVRIQARVAGSEGVSRDVTFTVK